MGFHAPFTRELEAQIQEAWEHHQIVVLLVDGYSLYRDSGTYEAVLQSLDRVALTHWCVLVPWSHRNPDLKAKRKEVMDALERAFYVRSRHLYPAFYRDGIRSDKLTSAAREALFRLKEEVQRHAKLARRVAPVLQRPILKGGV